MRSRPNLELVELAARELCDLLDSLVLVGGCAVDFLITDPASPPVRQTIDVDLVTEVAPLGEYYRFCDNLARRGFEQKDEIVCRWHKGKLILDIMPVDHQILGFSNSWYRSAVTAAEVVTLSGNRTLKIINAPHFLATKLESFRQRGKGDYLHHDIEDIINVINGRPSVCDEIAVCDGDVKLFLAEEFDALLGDPAFSGTFVYHLHPQEHAGRADLVLRRMRTIAGI